jgi:hypothetical protein
MKESLSVRALDQRLQNVAGKDQTLAYRLRVTVANVVVGQMLPPGAVKGGTAMKIRLGESGSRFTPDLDTARRQSLAQFIEAFEDSLASGWHGFTGRLITRPAAKPAGVPAPYVMQPYEVKLAFHGKSWHTVKLELGHNEIGDADDPVYLLAHDIAQLFADVGLPEPAPIAVMRADHQIAQKLHACTDAGNERAHDLVDLQLLVSADKLDLAQVERPRCACSTIGRHSPGHRRLSRDRPGLASTARRVPTSTSSLTSIAPSTGRTSSSLASTARPDTATTLSTWNRCRP